MIRERFDARLGRVMYVDGTRVLEDVQEKLSWVRRRLDLRHPVSIQIAAVQFHSLAKAVRVVAPERGEARRFVPAPDHAGG